MCSDLKKKRYAERKRVHFVRQRVVLVLWNKLSIANLFVQIDQILYFLFITRVPQESASQKMQGTFSSQKGGHGPRRSMRGPRKLGTRARFLFRFLRNETALFSVQG